MTMRRMRLLLGVVVAGCVLAAAGAAELDAYGLLARGNEHQAAGRYEEALADYAEAAHRGLPPEYEAELLHNQAAAHFRLGQFDDARDLWNRAAPRRDAGFEARMRYNLGNANYAAALRAAQAGDAAQAQAALQRAGDQYRDAIRLDPQLTDARANLELLYRLRAELAEQDETPQTQPGEQSESAPDEQQSPDTQPSDSQSPPSTQPQPDDESPQDQQPEPQEQGEQPVDDQQQSRSEAGESGESQAGESGAEQEQDGTTEPADGEPRDAAEQQAQPSPLTPDQVERMLQRVRDRDRQRRERLRQLEIQRAMEAARNRPVERDW
jgi:Ca-activated chloride channel family protein